VLLALITATHVSRIAIVDETSTLSVTDRTKRMEFARVKSNYGSATWIGMFRFTGTSAARISNRKPNNTSSPTTHLEF
jgi:hypothetical protein